MRMARLGRATVVAGDVPGVPSVPGVPDIPGVEVIKMWMPLLSDK